MSSNLIRRVCVSTTLILGLLAGGQASAVPFSWDYSFKTPVFDNGLNALFPSTLDTIKGTFSFDSDDVDGTGYVGPNSFGPGSFSHTGDLDTYFDSSDLILDTDTDFKPVAADFWESANFSLGINFQSGNALAENKDTRKYDEPQLTNLSIAPSPVAQVPEPGMLSLLGLGLAGIALTRRRRNVAA